jgi:hypothetical protein
LFMSNEELGEKPVPLPLIHQKSHMDWPRSELGPQSWQASN